MKAIEKNRWFIKENELSISLMRFHVSIKITKNEKKVFYPLVVTDSDQKTARFNFSSLEEAVFFTEDVVTKKRDIHEVIDGYKEIYWNGEKPRQKKYI